MDNKHEYVHAGYQLMKYGKEIMSAGEQMLEEAQRENADKDMLKALCHKAGDAAADANDAQESAHIKTSTCIAHILTALASIAFLVYLAAGFEPDVAASLLCGTGIGFEIIMVYMYARALWVRNK